MDSGADAREAVEGAAARDDGHGTGTAQAAQESTVSPAALEVSPASNAAPVVEETRSEQGQDGQAEDAEEAGGSRQDSGAFKGGDAPVPAGTDSLRWRKRSREPDEPGAGMPEESAPRTRPTPSQGCIRESESECPGSAKKPKSQSITEASLGRVLPACFLSWFPACFPCLVCLTAALALPCPDVSAAGVSAQQKHAITSRARDVRLLACDS